MIESFDAVVMDGQSNYDIILGRDFLQKIGLTLDFATLKIKWMNMEISMKSNCYWNTLSNVQIAFAEEDEMANDGYVATILPSKYSFNILAPCPDPWLCPAITIGLPLL